MSSMCSLQTHEILQSDVVNEQVVVVISNAGEVRKKRLDSGNHPLDLLNMHILTINVIKVNDLSVSKRLNLTPTNLDVERF